ncbi:MAG TPA: septal ring lytic transglycosylase RlpA family protein [Mycobacteriales bacterium]|nr:septal ring lytic transglycosylase RlpA family protein [Mycobacteriales bacterium]
MGLITRAVVAGATAAGLALGPAAGAHAAGPPPAPPAGQPVTVGDLASLSAQVGALRVQADQAAGLLEVAVARSESLRVSYDRLLAARAALQDRLNAEIRRVYEADQPDPFSALIAGLAPTDVQVLALSAQNQVAVDDSLVAEVDRADSAVGQLRVRLEALRRQLLGPAMAAESAVEKAIAVLDEEQAVYGVQQAAARAALAQLSAQVTNSVAIEVGPSGLAVERAEAPVLAVLDAAGPGIPAGYAPSGAVITGVASWYGPGFVGSLTASGAPYDPEKLTCAMLTVPLETVVHVTANGRAVNCLVDDRGPYVAGRVIDMSRAGSRALGYDGLAQVQITVLTPTG